MKTFTSKVSTTASSAFVPVIVALIPSSLLAYGYAIWRDYERGDWGWLITDICFPPIGLMRGLALLFMN